MRDCNKLLEYAKQTSEEGIYFASTGIIWDDAVVCSISDASFCNEEIVVDGEKDGDRSQQGYIICLAPAGIVNMTEAVVHPSGLVKRGWGPGGQPRLGKICVFRIRKSYFVEMLVLSGDAYSVFATPGWISCVNKSPVSPSAS